MRLRVSSKPGNGSALSLRSRRKKTKGSSYSLPHHNKNKNMSMSISNERVTTTSVQRSTIIALWCMGLFNNASYVVMIAGAKSISEGGTGLVFLMDVLPSLLVKLSAPYWFHKVSYQTRICSIAALFASSLCTVGFFAQKKYGHDDAHSTEGKFVVGMELVGVGLTSLGSGMGEASLLALAGLLDPSGTGSNITAFSSGTGLAGVFGFLWNTMLVDWIGVSFTTSLTVANILPFLYAFTFFRFLKGPLDERLLQQNQQPQQNGCDEEDADLILSDHYSSGRSNATNAMEELDMNNISSLERVRFIASLWPYMIPLFTVYFAEYALQSGPWTAIGFPVSDPKARNKFYKNANWMYQIGVFLSRSSGTVFHASLRTLWILPGLQVMNLVFFTWTATTHVWYNWSLLLFCFSAGLLGGGVYVNAYTRICIDLPTHQVEFALASASIADGVGIVLADVAGIFIQSCLYLSNGSIPGAVVTCPLTKRS